ncbi:enoyl-CoA hydratase/isomerase family protein [Thalassobacillus devorans]|uniref:enoyl-CoA hydratase/isomerase family protein n=1 Tax=Thalassobacillus devorans TaxID=279813 RepID=UPI000A1C8611|nr:enoyl-CoA hydratase-related protein [Thalassobacillus devorans]
MKKVDVKVSKGIANVIMKTPPLNILSNDVKSEITSVFQSLSKNNDVRVILFESEGDHFCCGANLKEFPERIYHNKARDAWIDGHEMLTAIMNVSQPTIACVQGNVLGGGAELATAFDIRIFAEDITFGYPEVSRTVYPGNGGFERFIQLTGEAHAGYLFLSGEKVSAKEALRLGVANKVKSTDVFREEAVKLAERLASYSAPTIRTIKRAIIDYRKKESFYERGIKYFEELHLTEDINESVNAFLEKRQPVYKHR